MIFNEDWNILFSIYNFAYLQITINYMSIHAIFLVLKMPINHDSFSKPSKKEEYITYRYFLIT